MTIFIKVLSKKQCVGYTKITVKTADIDALSTTQLYRLFARYAFTMVKGNDVTTIRLIYDNKTEERF
jgi:hypothetical protein